MVVTIKDIATLAGVSKQTVSRALTGKPGVSPSTRARVESLSEQLGYRRNVAAQVLAAGTKHNVGVLMVAVAETASAVKMFCSYAECLEALHRELAESSLNMMLSIEHVVAPVSGAHGRLPKMIAEGHVDGLIVLVHMTETLANTIRALEIPFVVIDGESIEGVSTVNVAEEKTTGFLVGHLADLGHQRIAYLGSSIPTQFFRSRLRQMGYVRAMAARGLRLFPGWDSVGRTKGLVEDLFRRPEPPTAVVVWDDEDAAVVMRFLAERGFKVPQDVSVASAHARMMAQFLPLRPTHMLRPSERMAHEGIAALKRLMEHRDVAPQVTTLDPQLEIGRTTGPVSESLPARSDMSQDTARDDGS